MIKLQNTANSNPTDFSNLTCEVALKSNLIYFRRTHSFCSHFAKNYSSRVNEEKKIRPLQFSRSDADSVAD